MIRAYTNEDFGAVVLLWQEAFGDSEDDITVCLTQFSDYLKVYEKDGILLAMFMLLPVYADGKKGDYIYAVATAKYARGRGIATELLNYAKARIQNKTSDFLVLVPAKPSLFEFYEKRGFTAGSFVSKISYKRTGTESTKVTVSKITAKQMYARRATHLQKLAAWDEKHLSAIDTIYSGCYYALQSDNGNGFCLAYPLKDKAIASELVLNTIAPNDALSALCSYFGTDEIEAVLPDKNGEAFAMFYPAQAAELYFNIAIN